MTSHAMRRLPLVVCSLVLTNCSQIDMYTRDGMVGAQARRAVERDMIGHVDASFEPVPGKATVKPPLGGRWRTSEAKDLTWSRYKNGQLCLSFEDGSQFISDIDQTLAEWLAAYRGMKLIVEQHASLDELPELGEWPPYDKVTSDLQTARLVSHSITNESIQRSGEKPWKYQQLHMTVELCLKAPALNERTNFISVKVVPPDGFFDTTVVPSIFVWAVDR